MSRELLKRVRDTLHELEETLHDLYWDIQTALEQNGQKDACAWPAVADYEKEVGFEVSDAFKKAWAMARTRLSNESTTPAAPEPVAWIYQSTGFRGQVLISKEKQDMAAELWVESPLYLAPQKREPSMTGREMYQRGYAAAERDLKREPLSIDWTEAPKNTAIAKVALFWVTEDNLMLGRKDLASIEKPVEGDAK